MSASQKTELVQAGVSSPLDAFHGTITKTRTGPLYMGGLAVVAFAMVLLPLLYIALVGLVIWLIVLHLQYNTWILGDRSGRAGFSQFLIYAGPAVAGGILVFFMVKPFFAGKARRTENIALDPEKERLLFAFVKKICGLVGAPVPSRIDVDCQVNASASLRRGLWSKDLVLTLGLPLVAGLDMRQFAGVLAHEFGHFAQGAGMRLTYIIRRINFWFGRVVFERDEWDMKLDHSARGADVRIGIVLHVARGCVWATRRILWVLMQAGHAISCFMLRQMEYDADSYEAKLAGSDSFESTAARIRVLNLATQAAYEEVRRSWTSHRLPEDLPLLIGHKASGLPRAMLEKLDSGKATEKTRWFDTHPCNADRVRAARKLDQPGIFQFSQPSSALFSDFGELSKTATRHQYSQHLQLEHDERDLIPSEELLRESAAAIDTQARVLKYYGQVNISLVQLLLPTEGPVAPVAEEQTVEAWRAAVRESEALREEAEEATTEWNQQAERLISLVSAQSLAKAGFTIQPNEFGLPEDAGWAGTIETAASLAVEQTARIMSEKIVELEPFVSALRRRATFGLRAALLSREDLGTAEAAQIRESTQLLGAIQAEMASAHKMGQILRAFILLAQNRPNHSQPARVDEVANGLATSLQATVDGIEGRLARFSYPFEHARGQLTVAEYLQCEQPGKNSWERAYLSANTLVERIFTLNYKLLGRILAYVEAEESSHLT